MRGRADEKQLCGALPSWNRLPLPLPSLLFRYWATVGWTESCCVYCSTVIARHFLLIAVVQADIEPCECVWSSWESEAVLVWQVGLELSPVCVNRTFTESTKLESKTTRLLIYGTHSRRTLTFSSFVYKMSVWSEKGRFWNWKCFFLCYILLKREKKSSSSQAHCWYSTAMFPC